MGHGASCKWLVSKLLGSMMPSVAGVVGVVGRIDYVAVVVADDMGCC
jgi:hypothetical protein